MPGYVELFPKILFRSRNRAPFRVLVIGNCQARYLAPLLELALQDCACDYLSCHEIGSVDQHVAIDNYLDESRNHYQLVLAHPLGPDWHAIARNALIARFGRERTLFLLNIHFYGTHPDITTLGELATRTFSPMGGPHSRIALGGWMAGLSDNEIVSLFSQETIHKLGYLSLFEESAQQLRAREQGCDTSFTDDLLKLAKSAFSFYTFNHPTPIIFSIFVTHIRNILLVQGKAKSSNMALSAMHVTDTLASNGTWPIYPELREILAPGFAVGTHFILPDSGFGGQVINRDEFVRRSVAIYNGIGKEKIGELRQAQNSHELIRQLLQE